MCSSATNSRTVIIVFRFVSSSASEKDMRADTRLKANLKKMLSSVFPTALLSSPRNPAYPGACTSGHDAVLSAYTGCALAGATQVARQLTLAFMLGQIQRSRSWGQDRLSHVGPADAVLHIGRFIITWFLPPHPSEATTSPLWEYPFAKHLRRRSLAADYSLLDSARFPTLCAGTTCRLRSFMYLQ